MNQTQFDSHQTKTACDQSLGLQSGGLCLKNDCSRCTAATGFHTQLSSTFRGGAVCRESDADKYSDWVCVSSGETLVNLLNLKRCTRTG